MSHEPPAYNEQLIVEQIVAGQKDLFRLLVRRYQRPVRSMGMGFFRNAEDASDFTQEVFLKVYRNLSAFEGRSRFSTWLYRIAYNTAINDINRRKEYRSLAEENPAVEASDDETPERILIRGAARDAVLASLRELPQRYRICVDMFFFYDRSYQEIEAITGFPVNTIKSHVFRAKKLLREKLGFWNKELKGR
ncbi:MAG: sigma-70 family RNA polymerase sigma factor [Treponema sp.]|jgi:RNA polymerase sigma-70 factor (ECF subfamily)|nr:sigma-70 family RNA polymerase sigma factor [Treponema sp.]